MGKVKSELHGLEQQSGWCANGGAMPERRSGERALSVLF